MAPNRNTAGFSPEHVKVKIREIDEQHATFFDMLDRIDTVADDLYRPLDDDALDDFLDIMGEIREFAQDHFGTEEGYMDGGRTTPAWTTTRRPTTSCSTTSSAWKASCSTARPSRPSRSARSWPNPALTTSFRMDKPFGEFYNKNK